jgi:hypothetical protein
MPRAHIQDLPPASDARAYLRLLESERALASLEGLDDDRAYLDDLRNELTAIRAIYVGAAVTEIAVLHADLAGRLEG